MEMRDFMGERGGEIRLVLEEGKGEHGACSSILSWESTGFQDGKMGTTVKINTEA